MPPKTKSVQIHQELPEYLPPWESVSDTAGTLEIEREDPDEGLLDAWPAKEYGRMRIRDQFGGGGFLLTWTPPEGSEIPQAKHRIRIAGEPKRATGSTAAPDVDKLVDSKVRALLAEHGAAKQWAELLKVQREEMERQGSALITQFGQQSAMFMEQIKAGAESQTRFFEESRRRDESAREREERRSGEVAQRERERDEAARERERAAYQQELERTRAWTAAQMELVRSQSAGGPLDTLDGALELYERVKPLLGANGQGLGQTIVEALPGLFDGMGRYVEKQGNAKVKIAHAAAAREAAAMGQPIQLPAPETTEADRESIEKAQLVTYLGFLSSMEDESWPELIELHLSAGIVPTIAIGPIMSAKAGNVAPLVALLREVGADELLPRAAAAFAGARASGAGEVVEPASGA